MNKHFYRIVFNKARGLLMVVSEIVKTHQSQGRTPAKAKSKKALFATLTPITLLTYLALGLASISVPAYANTIIVDKNANKNQQPIVLPTANGATQINIQTPSKGGVSHNKYTQFDVSQKGVILNNSAKTSKTDLAGYINGNGYLQQSGGAKIILNEVNSKHASQLNGYIEVAGQKAQVVIANAAGITCNGCGFINANRATLTTGNPILENGQLKGYLVEQGQINVNGKGLDSSKQDYTDLIARSVVINAGLWANDATVITGKNEVSQDLTSIKALENSDDTNPKPEFSLDVAALGGMYAGKIKLVGTEKGVGVHNAGQLGASAGSLTITADGKIVNIGKIHAKDNIEINNKDKIINSKQIYSKKNIKLNSKKQVNNQGTLVAKNSILIDANTVTSNQNSTIAAGVDNKGKLTQSGSIHVQADRIKMQGKNVALDNINLQASEEINLDKSQTSAQELILSGNKASIQSAKLYSDKKLNLSFENKLDTSNSVLSTNQGIVINTNHYRNENGNLTAKESINITADQMLSQNAKFLAQDDFMVQANRVDATASQAQTHGKITLQLGDGTFNQANLLAGKTLTITANNLQSESAKLQAYDDVDINVENQYQGQKAIIATNKGLKINADQLNLSQSKLNAEQATFIHAKQLVNTQSTWVTNGEMSIWAKQFANQYSTIKSQSALQIKFDELDNSHGILMSDSDLNLVGTTFINQSGTIKSQKATQIKANQFDNQKSRILVGDSLTIQSDDINNKQSHWQVGHETKVQATNSMLSQQSIINSADAMLVTSNNLNLDNSHIVSGKDVTINSNDLSLEKTKLGAKGAISLGATNNINAQELSVTAYKDFTLTSKVLDSQYSIFNVLGKINATAQQLNNDFAKWTADKAITTNTIILNNQNATLKTNQSLNLIGQEQLNNDSATLVSQDRIILNGNKISNNQSLIQAKNGVKIDADTFNNNSSSLVSKGELAINANKFINQNSEIQTQGDISVIVAGKMDNQNSKLLSEENILLNAGSLDNRNTGIQAAKNLTLRSRDEINNQTAKLLAGNDINIAGKNINNQQGVIKAKHDITISGEKMDNQKGLVLADNNIKLIAEQEIQNQQAQMKSDKGEIEVTSLNINNSDAIATANKSMKFNGDTINNQNAQFKAQGIIIQASENVDNQQAKLISSEDIVIDSVNTLNQGAILSAEKDILLTSQNSIDNQQAILEVGHDIALQTDSINNQNSTINAQNRINLVAQTINNQRADIYAKISGIDISAQTLSNRNAALASKGNIKLTGNVIGNEHVKITSEKGITINGQIVENSDANISAKNALLVQGETIHNQRAKLLSENNIHLQATGDVENSMAEVLANGEISVQADNVLHNTKATISSNQGVTLSANQILNDQAKLTSNGHINITAVDDINNQQSDIKAKQITLVTQGDLKNQQAKLTAAQQLMIKANNINNHDANLLANDINIKANALTGDGNIQSKNDLILTLEQSFVNDREMKANGHLSITTQNAINNNNKLLAGNRITLNSNSLTNNQVGEIEAGQVNIHSDLVNNAGLVNGDKVIINAKQVDNHTQGRIYGDYISIQADQLDNRGNNGHAPIIASREKLDLGVRIINNTAHAQILSLGDMIIGGELDQNGHAINSASEINNHSATIESHGNLTINADLVNNINDHFVTELVQSEEEPERVIYFVPGDSSNGTKMSVDDLKFEVKRRIAVTNKYGKTSYLNKYTYLDWNELTDSEKNGSSYRFIKIKKTGETFKYFYHYDYTVTKFKTVLTETDPASISAGKNIAINSNTLNNDNSKIIAGNNLSIQSDTINNTSAESQQHQVSSGKVTYHYHTYSGGMKKRNKYKTRTSNYAPATEIVTIDALNKNILDHQVVQKSQLTPNNKNEIKINGDMATQSVSQTVAVSDKTKTNAGAITITGNNDSIEKTSIGNDVVNIDTNITAQTEITAPAPIGANNKQLDKIETISTIEPNLTIPDSSLHSINKDPDKNYVIETDPRFTDKNKWLSSDYMLNQLKNDPNQRQKRLGDGYYEQGLIKEQIVALTGQRYLGNYQNELEQYKSLMDAGVAFANAYGLSVGVELTAEQMNVLTTDIVWLVKKTILIENQPIEVLVPQVYVVNRPKLSTDGALLAGSSVTLNGKQIHSNGVIQGKESVVINSIDTHNAGTIYADNITISAEHDITNNGKLLADKTISLTANHDINLISTTHTESYAHDDIGLNIITNIDNVSLLQANEGDIIINAGHDINQQAGMIINNNANGQTQLTAQNDINLSTVITQERIDLIFGKDQHLNTDKHSAVGSEIISLGDVNLSAGHNVDITAGNIETSKNINIKANNDITINSAQEHETLDEYIKIKSKGTLSTKTKETTTQVDNTTQKGSQLSGDNVTITAQHDLVVNGSQVVGDKDVTLQAGNNVAIEASEESYYQYHQTTTKKSGLMSGGGLGVTIGKMKEDLKQTDTEKGYVGSVVGSTEGNVTIQTGKDINITGSDIIAKQDIKLTGENVKIESNDAQVNYKEEYTYEKSGLTLAVTGTAADAYEVQQTLKQSKETQNSKLKTLYGIKGAVSAAKIGQDLELAMQTNGEQNASGASIGISVSIGSEKTERTIEQEEHIVAASSITAGDNITIIATGNQADTAQTQPTGNIILQGSELNAGKNITLDAAQDINILGGLNTQHSDRKESHQSASAGVGITVGSNGTGIKFSGSASYSKEREKMDGSAWTESVISAGDKLTVNSGHDTTIVGGQLEGNKVEMNVGNNLNIQSLQDTDNYDYDKISASVNGSFTYGSGNVEANLTLGKTEMESNWASVTDQSGIFAKEGGYDITVGNNTDLKGAMIASEAKDKANNKLDTGTISFSDIENKADYHVDAVSVSIGTSPTTPGMSYHKSDSDHSTTHSAVEDGELIIRDKENQKQSINDLSHDTANANNPLEQIFDKQEHLDNIEIIETINAISKETISIIDTANKAKAEKARQDEINKILSAGEADKNENGYSQLTKEEQERYDEQLLANANKAGADAYDQSLKGSGSAMGSDERKHLNALTNIAKGLITGDITGTIGGVSAPYLAEQIKKYTEGNSEIANKTLHAVLGAAVAKLQGNSAIAGGAGAVTGEVVADIICDKLYGKDVKDLTEAEKENISALTQLATGLATVASTGGDLNATGTAVAAGKNAVENNKMVFPKAPGPLGVLEMLLTPSELGSGMLPSALSNTEFFTHYVLMSNFNLTREEAIQYVDSLPPDTLLNLVDFDPKMEDGKYDHLYANAVINLYNESKNNTEATESSEAITSSGAPGLPPDDDKDKRNNDQKKLDIKIANSDYLKRNGFDAHKIKEEFFGRGSNSKYDIYIDKKTGELMLFKKGGIGNGVRTGYFIK
ncbi:hemagglutinin repeat-containing protein [Orbaceae bacterium ac157xtp]